MKLRILNAFFFVGFIVTVVLAVAGVIVYLRRKRAADATAAVQLGLEHNASLDVSASDPGAAGLMAAAAAVRSAFEAGA